MKRILFLSIYIVIFFPSIINAKTTDHGVTIENNGINYKDGFTLYCSYENGDYLRISRSSSTDMGSVLPDNAPFSTADNFVLKFHNVMNQDGTVDCPLYIYGEATSDDGKLQTIKGFSNSAESQGPNYVNYALNPSVSTCSGKNCQSDLWTCIYTGRQGRLITQYDTEKGGYTIYFPDGTITEPDSWGVSSSCDDLYYNRKTHEIVYSKSANANSSQYLCDNRNDIDYYCSGECNFPENAKIDCYDIDTGTHVPEDERNPMYEDGELSQICAEEKVQNALKFLGYILVIVKILVPVLLIIFGSIDFGKAILSSKEDAISKSGRSLALRALCGVIIFFIPTIVNFVFNIVGHGNTSYNECRICIFEPKMCGKGR